MRPTAGVYPLGTGQLGGAAQAVDDGTGTDGRVVRFGTSAADGGTFQHPGIMLTRTQLDFVRDRIAAGAQPWTGYLAQLMASKAQYGTNAGVAFSSSTWTPHAVDNVRCPTGDSVTSTVECNDETNDATAAYTAALLYAYTTDATTREAWAQQAITIINAWSNVFRKRVYNGSSDGTANAAYLQASWAAPLWTKAAEIIRYTYTPSAGKTPLNLAKFNSMLNSAYAFYVKKAWPGGGANWLMSFDEASMDIAIYQDDHATYNAALARWKLDVPATIYLSSDVNPYPALQGLPMPAVGTLYDSSTTTPATMTTYWRNPSYYPDGLQGETCRDAAHMSMGFGSLFAAAESARIQGTDLYAGQAGRLAAGLELNAGYLSAMLGGRTPAGWPCPAVQTNFKNSGWSATFEIAYNEMVNRLGLAMPNLTTLLTTYGRPNALKVNHNMAYEGLTSTEAPRGTACAVPDSRLGSVTTTVSVPTDGSYRIWARTNPATAGATLLYAQIDGGCPLVLGGPAGQKAGQWSWVRYRDGDPSRPLAVTLSAGTHTVLLSGLSTDLQVSRLLVTNDTACQPSTLDNSCADSAPPTTPGGLTATPQSPSTISLAWSASSAEAGLDHYTVYRDGTQVGTTTDLAYTDSGLADGSAHTYAVTAVDKLLRASAPSGTVNARTPYPPLAVTARAPGAAEGALTLAADVSDPARVTRVDFTVDDAPVGSATGAPYQAVWDSTSVANGDHVLKATLHGVDDSVVTSDPVHFVLANADTRAPTVPAHLAATQDAQTTQTITWDPSTDNVHVAGYLVYRDGTQIGTSTGPAYSDTTVVAPQTYVYTVAAQDDAGNQSAPSAGLAVTVADTTAPAVPVNLAAVAPSQTTQVVSWDAVTDNVGVTSYTVYRDGTAIGTATTTSFTDTALTANQACSYTVTAVDAAGNRSAPSLPLSVVVADVTPPGTPGPLTANQDTQTAETVSWPAATDNVGVSGYTVYRDGMAAATTTATSYTDTGLAAGDRHSYAVVANDAAGNSSPSTASLDVTVLDVSAPSVPTGLATGSVTPTSVALSWIAAADNVGVTRYTVYRDGVAVATVTSPSFVDTTVRSNVNYAYTVSALDAAGNESAPSPPVTTRTPLPPDTTPPSAPTGVSVASVTGTSVSLTWTDATDDRGVAEYRVTRNGVVVASGLTATSYTDSGLKSVTRYTYVVYALDAAGNVSRGSSPLVAQTADSVAPGRPATIAGYAASTTSVALSWGAATDNVGVTGYVITRDGAVVATTAARTYTDTGLIAGVTYAYTVKAVDAAGNIGTAIPLSVSTVPESAGAGPGWAGSYFPNKTLSGAPITRLDPSIDFTWGTGAPIAGVPADNVSVRWTGSVTPATTGTYTIYADADDGVRVWINGTVVIDKWTTGLKSVTGTYAFTAGTRYDVRVEYYEGTGSATARLSWSGPGVAKAVVPTTSVSSASSGLTATYYKGNAVTGAPALVRTDSTINFDWGTTAPTTAVSADNFSARWTGALLAPTSGAVTLTTDSDEGVRVWVGGQLVIDNWTPHTLQSNSATLTLTAGASYPLRVEYREVTGTASAVLSWSYGSVGKTVVPASSLRDR